MIKQLYSVLLILSLNFSFSQTEKDTSINYKRRKIVLVTSASALAIGSLAYLYQEWYAQYNTGKFHFFNDNAEWLQMDKVGHVWTNYQTSRLMMQGFNWAGFTRKQKLIYGGSIGLVYMTAVECLDGYSAGWGFSWGDEVANALGAGLAIGQDVLFKEQRMQLKLSYAPSGLAQYNPRLLGSSFTSQLLKDYNGQTYWLSINPTSFIKKNNNFPKWLNVAFGYSAFGMTNAETNTEVTDKNGNVYLFNRERRFYFSLDVDLTRIKTKSKLLKSIFSVFNMVKFPAPALQFSNDNFRFYPFYY